MGTLYLVATPIGNLEDITLRALRILQEVTLIACEDTRQAKKLLTHYDIRTPITSYHRDNERAKLGFLLERLEEGDIALISEAGVPTLSDPGYFLVQQAIQQGLPVVPIPGPSAITAAVAASGLPGERFLYLGFLPRQKGQRRALLEALRIQPYTLVAFEAPHRLLETLEEMLAIWGSRRMAIGRELTKIYEEFLRGDISELAEHFRKNAPRGEFTLVIEGASEKTETMDEGAIREALAELQECGLGLREGAKILAKVVPLSPRHIYRLGLEKRKGES